MGGLIYVYPRIVGRQIAHRGLVALSFWAMAAIFPLFFAFFTLSGLTAAAAINVLGKTVYEAIPAQYLPRLFRTVSGTLLMAGWWTFAWVMWSSRKHGRAFVEGMSAVEPEESSTWPPAASDGPGKEGVIHV